jgi:hypothetical protein
MFHGLTPGGSDIRCQPYIQDTAWEAACLIRDSSRDPMVC